MSTKPYEFSGIIAYTLFCLFADVNGKKATFVDCKKLNKFIKPPTSILSLKGGHPLVCNTVLQINTLCKESEHVSGRFL